jgi:hypothetical protein
MAAMSKRRSRFSMKAWPIAILMLLTPGLANAEDARDAKQVLKAMADYVTSQKNVSFAFDSTIEVVTPKMQKIQFASSGKVLLSRPDKLHATRTGGYADVELVSDGKTATLYGKNRNVYAEAPASGSIDQLIGNMREKLGVEMPGADLLLSTVYQDLSEDVVDAVHIGRGVINGVECEHLAFRNDDVDWQLWVETGPKPIPRKYVITTNGVNGGPQYSLVIRDWKTDVQPSADAFAFKPAAGAKKADFAALSDLDEVPHGQMPTTTGAK